MAYEPHLSNLKESNDLRNAIEAWKQMTDKDNNDNWQNLQENKDFQQNLIQLFYYLGFENPEIHGDDSHNLWLIFDAQNRTVCPLPPLQIGITPENKGGRQLKVRYAVKVMKDVEDVFNMFTAAQSDLGDKITILLCPFVINFEDRAELLKRSRDTNAGSKNYFLLDKCFIRFAMYFRQADRLKVFYHCCTHLMKLICLYSVNTPESAGEGLFYGRELEIAKINQSKGVCVIFGGRRLGKTCILRELEYRWINQSDKNLVVYLDLKAITNNELPEMVLWYAIANKLSNKIEKLKDFCYENQNIGDIQREAKEYIIPIITEYLKEKDGKLLLLLDESDVLVFHDVIRSKERDKLGSRLSELLSLIKDSENRVKVVMAGLDRVTRFVRTQKSYDMNMVENWDGYQKFNNPIPLKPLLGNDMRNAYELVDIPFKIMGFELKHESIMYILRVCCYRPNLIQNYCSHLLNYVYRNASTEPRKDSLLIPITHDQVTSIFDNDTFFKTDQLEQSVRIPLNVGGTKVYAPVAYAVALMSDDDPMTGMYTGFSAKKILEKICNFNAEFTENTASSLQYITAVLDDLCSMGVLRRITMNSIRRYALFSIYMRRMIGDNKNSIEEKLKSELETYVNDNKDTSEQFREMYAYRYSNKDSEFDPLTIDQIEALYNTLKENGYAVVVGSEMLLMEKVPDLMNRMKLSDKKFNVCQVNADELDELMKEPEKIYDSSSGREMLLLLINEGWSEEHVNMISQKHKENSDVMAVMLADANVFKKKKGDDTYELDGDFVKMLDRFKDSVIHLTRLERSFLYSWFEHMQERGPERFGDDETKHRDVARRIGDLTHNWPLLAYKMRELFDKDKSDVDAVFEAYKVWIDKNRDEIIRKMGLDLIDLNSDLWLEVLTNNSVSGCKNVDENELRNALKYLYHINVIEIIGNDSEESNWEYIFDKYAYNLINGGNNG